MISEHSGSGHDEVLSLPNQNVMLQESIQRAYQEHGDVRASFATMEGDLIRSDKEVAKLEQNLACVRAEYKTDYIT